MVLNDVLVSKCLFNPLVTDISSNMGDKVPILHDYSGTIPINNVLKYLILVYDIQSPAQKEYRDYYQRKRECAKASHFPIGKDGKWTDESAGILIGQNDWFNSLVVKYLALLALPEYTQLILYLELLARRTKKVLDGEDDDKTHIVIKNLTETIKQITNDIFGSGEIDEIQQVRRALYEQAEDDRVRLRPEDVVALLNDGGIPSSWGYEEGYTPDNITFIGDTKPRERKA